jgi:hypothetical protein
MCHPCLLRSRLETLDVSNNRLRALPRQLARLPLKSLAALAGNDLDRKLRTACKGKSGASNVHVHAYVYIYVRPPRAMLQPNAGPGPMC